MSLIIVVLAGFVLAVFAPYLAKFGRNPGLIFALLPLSIAVYLSTFIGRISHGETIVKAYEWVPSLDVRFSFYIDGLSLMMALLVSGMGALVFVYAGGYLHGDEGIGRFFTYLLIFMSAMLGVVLSSNLVTLFVFWELTSISSYLLIGYKHKYEASREAARQALIITGGGGLALMAGLILIGEMGGSYELYTLLNHGTNDLTAHAWYVPALLCVLAGAFTKSAQVPFHFWLPGAMAAPTPVSAYLHSATMVKAGIYLLARLTPLMGSSDLWFYIVTAFGALTMLIGAFLSWQNSDLKKILAYSTISVLGTLMLLLGLGSQTHYAIEALVIFLLAHAFYKGCLFMVAGSIDHETGTREIDQLSGLRHKMPITFAAATLAALSKAGIPLFLGFVGKELLYEATLHAPAPYILFLTAAAVLSNAMVGASAALVILRPFLGKELRAPKEHVHEAPPSMWIGPIILGALSLIFGLIPSLLDDFGSYVVSAISGNETHLHLAIFHFPLVTFEKPILQQPFVLSVITVSLAALIYVLRDRLVPLARPLRGDEWGAQRAYKILLNGFVNGAQWVTDFLQNGNLRWYIGIIISTTIVLVGTTIYQKTPLAIRPDFSDVEVHEFGVFIIIIIAAISAAASRSRLAAIAALGVVGFSMALFFILFEAPDLAMTQFAIETLSVILIALIMGKLPLFSSESGVGARSATLVIAVLAGILMTTLVMITLSIPLNSRLTPYFAENSYTLAHGRNIVNVILVDFRGFDTFGEITVLAIAGIGVYALSKLRLRDEEAEEEQTA